MVRYRRAWAPGGSFFFTVTLLDRGADTLTRHIGLLRESMRAIRRQRSYRIEAIVVLPDHLHTVWTLPGGDGDFSGRWRAIKSSFVRALQAHGSPLTPNARGEHAVWQRRFWEHQIRDARDLARHIDYIHHNPVKHGLVTRAIDWPWSSFHRYVRAGLLAPDWAQQCAAVTAHGE